MKAKHFKLMRKRVKDKVWLEKELWKISNVYDDLNHFYKFECNPFFTGELKAELNKEKYGRVYTKTVRKEKQIKGFLEVLQ